MDYKSEFDMNRISLELETAAGPVFAGMITVYDVFVERNDLQQEIWMIFLNWTSEDCRAGLCRRQRGLGLFIRGTTKAATRNVRAVVSFCSMTIPKKALN
jgi:hypothetical protein